ncbi:Cytochrome c oxidase subunit CcoQ [hydrothermal vent metagenome]|uniref:Cytochrome c oxidase subunit CcoQ n=1 Tax=hydrothermal vent metagenome TaxID=652676 RepID=A0A3B1AD70_9ZZZZ
MDIHTLQSFVTLIWILVFLGIVIWAYSRKRKKDFKEAANLPLTEPEHPVQLNKHQRGEHE